MVEKGDVFALRRKMGMVFQSFQLFSNRTVLDNVTAGLRHLLKIPRKMTMLIVTHEMRFARDVANRVFYLDEGVLYEEGDAAGYL